MTDLTIAVLLYTLAAYRPRRISVAGLAACLFGSAVAIARSGPPRPRQPARRPDHRHHRAAGSRLVPPPLRVVIAEDAAIMRDGLTQTLTRVGYLLKDRVADVGDFIDAISRVAQGGTVLDPEVVRQLLRASRRADSLAALTRREKDVLSLMAQGRSYTAPSDSDNRRVIAALKYLES